MLWPDNSFQRSHSAKDSYWNAINSWKLVRRSDAVRLIAEILPGIRWRNLHWQARSLCFTFASNSLRGPVAARFWTVVATDRHQQPQLASLRNALEHTLELAARGPNDGCCSRSEGHSHNDDLKPSKRPAFERCGRHSLIVRTTRQTVMIARNGERSKRGSSVMFRRTTKSHWIANRSVSNGLRTALSANRPQFYRTYFSVLRIHLPSRQISAGHPRALVVCRECGNVKPTMTASRYFRNRRDGRSEEVDIRGAGDAWR